MKLQLIITILILFVLTIKLSSQEEFSICRNYAKIPKENIFDKDSIFIKIDEDKSDFYLNVLLVNNSPANIYLYGYNNKISFLKKAQKKNGSWENIDNENPKCATGFNRFILPPFSYTWEKFYKTLYTYGDFETLVKFYINFNDSTIYSIPINAKIDSIRFSEEKVFILAKLNKTFEVKSDSQSVKIFRNK